MNLKFAFAALVAMAVASPALAQGFTGPRVEITGAYDHVNTDIDYDDGVDAFSSASDNSDVAFGAEVGYDVQFGDTVVGTYAGVDLPSVNNCDRLDGTTVDVCLNSRRNLTVGVRAGVAASPVTLIYGKAGYTNGRFNAVVDDATDGASAISDAGDLDGFHLGVGAEMAVSNNAYIKAEYVYTSYDTQDDATLDADISRNQVKMGIGLRF